MNRLYDEMTDEELIAVFKEGEKEAVDFLMEKYKGIVKRKARTMFLVGGDTDDLIQEGMIGLYKAVRDFDTEKQASFLTFANLCIDRQIYTAINASNRKKHLPLNTYISFLTEDTEDGEKNEYLIEEPADKLSNPEELYIDKENVEYIERALEQKLSSFEYQVLKMYIDGDDYQKIAIKLDKTSKSIDNALQRIKGKVNNIIMMMK